MIFVLKSAQLTDVICRCHLNCSSQFSLAKSFLLSYLFQDRNSFR
uniref:Uncharacterized protein n=1 Tax=Manihot esculenta TaxID=3983 RepID=A0A2C9V5V6_MANES